MKRRRKLTAAVWTALFATGTITLVYWEMTALLYILATLGVSAILVIVALSDLARGEKHNAVSPPADSAGIGSSGIVSTYGTNKS